MTLRTSLQKLIRRDPVASLRERAAELQARIPTPKPAAEPQAEAPPSHAEQVAQAGLTGDVLAASGIDHRDGTVSYADATGKVVRRPMARWITFTAMQMRAHVQAEMGRRRGIEAGDLSAEEHAAWEARIRRELRIDAVHALTFRHDRAFEAAQAVRTGSEPATQALREQGDAELVALVPLWDAAVDLLQQRTDEENAVCEAASGDGWPGPAPEGAGAEWRAWFQQKEDWREQTGVAAAEEASAEAGRALYAVELQIAGLSAASLAGLKLKARVAQRSDDIGVAWPDGLGEGLARDLLTFTAPPEVDWYDPPPGFMASPAIKPFNFAQISDGIAIELERLRGIAMAEFNRRVGPETSAGEIARISLELRLDVLANAVQLDDSIPGQVDVASANLLELRAIREKMSLLSDVAYGMASQDCCKARDDGHSGSPYNAAGLLMHWLADEFTTVEDRAGAELQRRQPTEFWDRRTRLAAVAERVIMNGDDDETAALIQDLAAFAAEQARG